MLDEKDLQAIAQLLENQKQDIMGEVKAAESRIMQGAAALMDAEFSKHFHLLSEQQEASLSHAATDDDLAIIEGRIDDLEAITRVHAEDIEMLKKAN